MYKFLSFFYYFNWQLLAKSNRKYQSAAKGEISQNKSLKDLQAARNLILCLKVIICIMIIYCVLL